MTLLKPTRRDIVKAAATEARKKLFARSQELSAASTEKQNEANAQHRADMEKAAKKHICKLQPLADKLNDITEEAGHGRPFGVETRFCRDGRRSQYTREGYTLYVYLTVKGEVRQKTKAKCPGQSKKVQELFAESNRLRGEAQKVNTIACNLTEKSVVSGAINNALNGEAKAALQVLVDNITEVSLEVLPDDYRVD